MALQTLVNALGQQSVQCYPLLAAVLQHCTDVSQVPRTALAHAGLLCRAVPSRSWPWYPTRVTTGPWQTADCLSAPTPPACSPVPLRWHDHHALASLPPGQIMGAAASWSFPAMDASCAWPRWQAEVHGWGTHSAPPQRAGAEGDSACLQPDELTLLEDGLQLWVVALRNAPRPDPGLLSLFPRLQPIMQASTGAAPAPALQCMASPAT